jgi:hypothetical protein
LQAICKEFLPYLNKDNRIKEKAKLEQLKKGKKYLIPEEHKVAARPIDAGSYWTLWNPFCVT